MLKTTLIDEIIDNFKKHPYTYDRNEYVAYEACKKVIRDMEKTGEIPYDCDLYRRYIEYITDRLEI